MNEQNYTFGDSERAALRLELLARVYEMTTRVVLVRALGFLEQRPTLVLDAGAGPGATTQLLAEVIAPREVIGLDRSPRFVARARALRSGSQATRLAFVEHDVLVTPYPVGPSDLVYCRHLLTHLPDPGAALRAFLGALAPAGLVVLEETAFLRSSDPVFALYYARVAALQEHYGQNMRVGEELGRRAAQQGARIFLDEVTQMAFDPVLMAQLHAQNIATWSCDAFAQGSFDPQELAYLAEELAAVASGRRAAPPVEVGIAQVVLGLGEPGR